MKQVSLFPIVSLLLILVCQCLSLAKADNAESLDDSVQELIQRHNIGEGLRSSIPIPPIDSPLAQLGKDLFFSKSLSGNFDVACATCHQPMLGGGDGLALSKGVKTINPPFSGSRRKHINGNFITGRNTPTIFNIAFWKQALFWDGRIQIVGQGIDTPESSPGSPDILAPDDLLSAQAHFPVASIDEMRGRFFEVGMPNQAVRLRLAARIGGYEPGDQGLTSNSWPQRFSKIFNTENDPDYQVSYNDIGTALAAYQRSQVFINTAWDRYVHGDQTALSDDAKKGALLFYADESQGGYSCVRCHTGDFFTDEKFYVMGAPQIGPGKNNGEEEADDFGRARVSLNQDDKYGFRTPTLLNVEMTAPYLHNGSAATLQDVIHQHLNPSQYINNYFEGNRFCLTEPFNEAPDCANLYPDMERNSEEALKKVPIQDYLNPISDLAVEQLVAFLKTLTDPCTQDLKCMSAWQAPSEFTDPHRFEPLETISAKE